MISRKKRVPAQPLAGSESAVARFFTDPRVSYSVADIAHIFGWDDGEATVNVRIAVNCGQLEPFAHGRKFRFGRSSVERFVIDCLSDSPALLANILIAANRARLCLPTELLRRMLQAASEGRWKPAPDALRARGRCIENTNYPPRLETAR